MLEQSDVSHYLLSLGVVKARAVVEEDLTIVDASRRNRVFIASTGEGPAYVVKQAGPAGARTLAHEAAVLRALAREPGLVAHVPAVVHHDPEAARLILRTPAGGRDWTGRGGRTLPRVLGHVLAGLHALGVDDVEHLPDGIDRMWALLLPEPPRELMLGLGSGAQAVVARVQTSSRLCARLDRLRETCEDDGVVHGDLRWDNCLSVAAPGNRRRTRLLVVDWELAGSGTVGYDVGTVLAEYLHAWVEAIPIVDAGNPGRLVARAAPSLRRIQPAMQAFWSAYRGASTRAVSLRRAVELAAVHLVQTAVERAQGLPRPSAHVMALVQLADNMLHDPDDVALNLMALRE